MYNKPPYTPGMREALKLSKAEASRLGHDFIGPEHFLLGIVRKGDGLGVQTLNNLEIALDDLKVLIERRLKTGKGPRVGLLAPNSEAKRVLETARDVAIDMKHGWIGTEHLLLGLIKERETLPSMVLHKMGVDFESAHREVLVIIEGSDAAVKALKPKKRPQESRTDEENALVDTIADLFRKLGAGCSLRTIVTGLPAGLVLLFDTGRNASQLVFVEAKSTHRPLTADDLIPLLEKMQRARKTAGIDYTAVVSDAGFHEDARMLLTLGRILPLTLSYVRVLASGEGGAERILKMLETATDQKPITDPEYLAHLSGQEDKGNDTPE